MRHELTDDFVTIRRHDASLADKIYDAAMRSLDEVGQWMPWLNRNYTSADSASWIAAQSELWEKGEAYEFAVLDAAQHFLGCVGLNRVDMQDLRANVGYWVDTAAAGRGIATSAVRLLAEFGFTDIGLRRLEIVVEPGNVASLRVAAKLGAQRKGLMRDRLVKRGKSYAAWMFSLLPADMSVEP
jgi:ribosomal-protein-serine acetyltransferase